MNLRWQQITGFAGIVFAVLSVIAGVVLAPQPPMVDDSVSKIVSYYADHQTGLLVATYVFGLSWVAFAIFLAGLWRALQGADMWAALVIVCGAVWLSLNMVSQALIGALTARIAQHFPNAATMVGLHDMTVMLFALSFFGVAGMMMGAVRGGAETGAFGRWHSVFGGAVAVVALVTALSLVWPTSSGLFALLVIAYGLFVVWVVWAGVALLRTRAETAAETAPRTSLAEVRA